MRVSVTVFRALVVLYLGFVFLVPSSAMKRYCHFGPLDSAISTYTPAGVHGPTCCRFVPRIARCLVALLVNFGCLVVEFTTHHASTLWLRLTRCFLAVTCLQRPFYGAVFRGNALY
jgi:hypothetical protein